MQTLALFRKGDRAIRGYAYPQYKMEFKSREHERLFRDNDGIQDMRRSRRPSKKIRNQSGRFRLKSVVPPTEVHAGYYVEFYAWSDTQLLNSTWKKKDLMSKDELMSFLQVANLLSSPKKESQHG